MNICHLDGYSLIAKILAIVEVVADREEMETFDLLPVFLGVPQVNSTCTATFGCHLGVDNAIYDSADVVGNELVDGSPGYADPEGCRHPLSMFHTLLPPI
jgi:hypothetical protein